MPADARSAPQYLGDLPARDHTVARVAGMTRVALQEDETVLAWRLEVEPAGPHDRVRQAAGAHEPLPAALPVVDLGGPVEGARTVGHADRRHQGDADRAATECTQHVAHAAVVDLFGRCLAAAVAAMREHVGVDAFNGSHQGGGLRQIADDAFRLRGQIASAPHVAHQRPH